MRFSKANEAGFAIKAEFGDPLGGSVSAARVTARRGPGFLKKSR
jgi:hypothetical protein